MHFRARLSFFLLLSIAAVPTHPAFGQRAANANTVYQQLRGLLPGNETIAVKDFALKRDAAEFTFRSGSFAFYGPVNGKVTGAVFKGEGHLHITPPTPEERHNLAVFTHSDPVPSEEFDEDFDEVVLRFTDSTADELHKASTQAGEPDNSYNKAAEELRSFLRHHAEGEYDEEGHTIYYGKFYGNLDLRLLEDVLSPAPIGYFFAAIHGKQDSHLFFIYDPHGVDEVAPEEVALLRWDTINESETIPLAFHRAAEYADGTASGNEHNAAYKILHQDLDVSIEKSGFLSNVATVEVEAEQDGVAVIPLDLYPTLRVSQVSLRQRRRAGLGAGKQGPGPEFRRDSRRTAQKGRDHHCEHHLRRQGCRPERRRTVTTTPSHAKTGFPTRSQGLGDYATYHMLFHVPKDSN